MNNRSKNFRPALALAFAFTLVLAPIAHCQSDTNVPIPEIVFNNVPITDGIKNLARLSGINYIMDPNLFSPAQNAGTNFEPKLTLRWKNISAPSALERLLKEHGLFMVENHQTGVARFSSANLPPRNFDRDFLGGGTNAVIPMIVFSDASLGQVFVHLAETAGPQVELDPKLSTLEAMVDVRWHNLTAKQALAAICENYNLRITKGEKPGGWRISSN